MLKELVGQYQKNLRVSIPDWLKSYDKQDKKDYIELKKRQKLVCSVLSLIRDRGVKWSVCESSKLAMAILTPDSFIIVQEMTAPSSRWTEGTFYTHVLTFFEQGKEALVIKEYHDGYNYDELSAFLGQLPIVDLYDLATKEKRRKGCLSHVCGLQGFGAPGDVCSACEGERSYPHSATELPY